MTAAPRGRVDHPGQRAVVAVILVLATTLIALPLAVWPAIEMATSRKAEVRHGDSRVSVTLADTPLRRAQGLQGRSALGADEGMLFVLAAPGRHAFSRKSVPFDLDLVFATSAGRVVGVARLDERHPRVTSPDGVSYVLEVRAGWASEHGVTTGSTLVLP